MSISKMFLIGLGAVMMVAGAIILIAMAQARVIDWFLVLPVLLLVFGFQIFTGKGLSL